MDYSFSADYGLTTAMPAFESVNYFTPLKPISYDSGFTLGETVKPEVSNFNISDGQSANYVENALPSVKPSGGTFDGILNTVTATANGFLDTIGKAYALKNQFESQKLGQKIAESDLELKSAQLGAQIDIAKTNALAQRDIEIARAGSAVADAQTQLRSSQGASVVTMKQEIPWAWLGAAVVGVIFLIRRRGAK